jgi:hypothetical protein
MNVYNHALGYLVRMVIGKEKFCYESFTINKETLRQMQNRSAQRQSIYHLRKSKA